MIAFDQQLYPDAADPLGRQDVVAEASANPSFDELYGYDAMQRLKAFARGTLDETESFITGPTLQQSWHLDATGNWVNFDNLDQLTAANTLMQKRASNAANEINAINRTVGPAWATPAYDRNGNMTSIPQPLAGMPLKSLDVSFTLVSDLSPIRGAPLTWLHCQGTSVIDLSPLRGAALAEIAFSAAKITKPLGPIRQMKSLDIIQGDDWYRLPSDVFWEKYDAGEFLPWNKSPTFKKWISDVAALPPEQQAAAVAKKLQALNPGFDGNETHKIEAGAVVDFQFLTDGVTDLSPVRALTKLRHLECNGAKPVGCPLFDLSPLEGMPLASIMCDNTRVYDLSPLRGMPLARLQAGGTQIADLSPLRGLPLVELFCDRTAISDLSPLEGMNLTTLAFTPKNIKKGLDAIRRMTTLASIGTQWDTRLPPADFWKKYDAGEFNK